MFNFYGHDPNSFLGINFWDCNYKVRLNKIEESEFVDYFLDDFLMFKVKNIEENRAELILLIKHVNEKSLENDLLTFCDGCKIKITDYLMQDLVEGDILAIKLTEVVEENDGGKLENFLKPKVVKV